MALTCLDKWRSAVGTSSIKWWRILRRRRWHLLTLEVQCEMLKNLLSINNLPWLYYTYMLTRCCRCRQPTHPLKKISPFSTPLNTWNRDFQQLQHLSTLYKPSLKFWKSTCIPIQVGRKYDLYSSSFFCLFRNLIRIPGTETKPIWKR